MKHSNNKNMTDGDGNVLNFETAMAHFRAMFPDLSAHLIESVLRKYDGNVAQTIEELLERSAVQSCCATSSSRQQQQCAPSGDGSREEEKEKIVARAESAKMMPSSLPAPQPNRRDPCADDEKIALLIQNREFLRYLRHDAHFQRAMIGQHQASARHAHHYPLPSGALLPAGPALLLSSSRPFRSPNTGRLFNRHETSRQKGPGERPEPVPDGPIVGQGEERGQQEEEEGELAIPEGPLIDYVDADGRDSGWAGRIKAKMGGGKRAEGADPLPLSPLVHFSDEQMQKGVQGVLARGGKGLLEGLARKFSARKQRVSNSNRRRMDRGRYGEEEGEGDGNGNGGVGY